MIMRGNDKFAAALFWQKTSQGWHPILPMRGLGILLGLVALVLVMAYVVDRELAELTKREVSNSFSWKDENQKISSVNYKKITNSLKSPIFRSAGYTPPKIDQKRKRILIIGDSFIWGEYVESNDTLSAHLNRLTGKDRFANLGVNGLHPMAAYGLLKDYGSDIQNKGIILYFNPLWIQSLKDI